MTNPSTIAYLRVSTGLQDLQKNKADILHLANEKNLGRVTWVEETVSGRVSWKKRKIATVLADMQPGDTLIVSELSRLGRSMLECMEILALAAEKRVRVCSVKGEWQLDNTIQSKIMAMVFAMAAEIERDLISQRTTEALAAKKRAGAKLGRPTGPGRSKLEPYRLEIEALLANGATQQFIAERYGTAWRGGGVQSNRVVGGCGDAAAEAVVAVAEAAVRQQPIGAIPSVGHATVAGQVAVGVVDALAS